MMGVWTDQAGSLFLNPEINDFGGGSIYKILLFLFEFNFLKSVDKTNAQDLTLDSEGLNPPSTVKMPPREEELLKH